MKRNETTDRMSAKVKAGSGGLRLVWVCMLPLFALAVGLAEGRPLLEAARERLRLAEEGGSADLDFSAIMKLL